MLKRFSFQVLLIMYIHFLFPFLFQKKKKKLEKQPQQSIYTKSNTSLLKRKKIFNKEHKNNHWFLQELQWWLIKYLISNKKH